MGQYKGKRESSRPEHEPTNLHQKQPSRPQGVVDDPFANEKLSFGERVENFFLDTNWFFHSKKGKVLVTVLCSILVLSVCGVVGFKMWMGNAPLPPVNNGSEQTEQNTPNQGGQSQNQNTPPNNGGESSDVPPGPSDDELYPDDGYSGEMPEVSGQRKKGVYTFLLVGTDQGDGNTDTIMVASYDTVNQKVSIMSIPRDTMINESWDLKKINSVYSRTGNSIDALANRVKKLVGFKPDYYVKVKLSVFVELVDLIGGVEFYVPRDMNYDDPYQDLHIHLKQGLQVLDGAKAMQLVRFRGYSKSDIGRIEVQQDFMKALIQECISLKHWGKIKAYIDLAVENVQTDIELKNIVWFASNVMGLNNAPMLSVENVDTYTLPGDYYGSAYCRSLGREQSYVTIYPNQVVKLVNESFNPYVQNVTTGMLDAMSILKNGDIASSTGVLKDTKHNEVMAVMRGEAYYDVNGNIVYGRPENNDADKDTDNENTGTGGGNNGTTGENQGEGEEPTIPDNGGTTVGGKTDPDENTTPPDDTTPPDNGGTTGDKTDPDDGDTPDDNDGNQTQTGNGETGSEPDDNNSETGDEPSDEPVIEEPTIPPTEPTEPNEGDEGTTDNGGDESNTGDDVE